MTTKHLILVSAALIAVSACSQADNTASDANAAVQMDNLEGNAAPAQAAGEDAATFANMVAASDQFEIESGKAAAAAATSPEIKNFGTMLVAEHQKSTADLKAAAGPEVTPMATLAPDQTAMLTALKAAQGPAFDKLFLEQQVAAHRKTHASLMEYSASGGSETLRSFATKASAMVKQHLDKAEALASASR